MKLCEIVDLPLDEGWKNWVAAASIGAAAVGGVSDKMRSVDAPAATRQEKPAMTLAKKMIASAKNEAERVLIKYAVQAGIEATELKQFIAQCAHETGNFTHLAELGSDSYLMKLYDRKFAPAKAKALGNKYIGDGIKYKGRGFIQLTGRYNYAKAGAALGLPLEDHPELVERPDIAAKVAIWFWQNRVAPKVTDFGDVAMSTKPINPGLKGLKNREAHYDKYSLLN